VAGDANVVIAFPKSISAPPAGPPVRVRIGTAAGTAEVTAEVACDLAAMAPKVLEARMGTVWGRMVARALVKFLLSMAIEKAGEAAGGKNYGWVGLLAGMATRATFSALERADVRAWGTLPAQARIAVAEVPPGAVQVEVVGAGGAVIAAPMVTVRPDRATWVLVRTR
jgi:hypothetical protein